MKHVILLMGLPRSGKSTIAQELHKELGYPIVCPDDFRIALHGEAFLPSAERSVWAMAYVAGRALLRRHQGLIVDACNRSRRRRDEWTSELELTDDLLVEVLEVDTPASECILRTGNPSLRETIERMASGFEHRMADERKYVPREPTWGGP